MKAVIIDDEVKSREALADLLQLYCPAVSLLGWAETGEKGLELIRQKRPDLVFLDVEMPDIDGFELLRRLDRVDFALVFVTAYNQYAVRAFELSALDYLLKPVDAARLVQTVHRAGERQKQRGTVSQYQLLLEMIHLNGAPATSDHRIVFATQNEIVYSWLRNLIRIDADTNFSYIKLTDQSKPLHIGKNIGEYEKILEGHPHFMRVHRSHLINLFHVKKYLREDGMLLMTDGLKIPVAANKREEVLQRLQSMDLGV